MQWDKESTGTCPADQIRVWLFKIWGGKDTVSLCFLWPTSNISFRGSAYPNYKINLFSNFLLQWWWIYCVWYLAMQPIQEKHILSMQNTTVGGTSKMVINKGCLMTLTCFTNKPRSKGIIAGKVLMFHFKVSVYKIKKHISIEQWFTRWLIDRRKEKQYVHNALMLFCCEVLNSFTSSGFWKLFKRNNLRSINLLTDRLTDMCNLWQRVVSRRNFALKGLLVATCHMLHMFTSCEQFT